MNKILLVEDNEELNIAISDFLKSLKYGVTSIFNGNDAINIIDINDYDLYIVDINIPHISGLDVVKYIRQKNNISSIIVITASLGIDCFVDAFNNGCNEFIKKPFHLKELYIRMKKLIKNLPSDICKINDSIYYNFELEELIIENKVIHLRKKANRLLKLLLKNINKTVNNDEIINYVWENDLKENYPLRQLVTELRKELGSNVNFITAKVGVGYKFSR